MSKDKWIVVDEVAGILQAKLIQSYFEAHDISVVLSQEAAGSVYPVTVGKLGEVQIFVPADDAERARNLLDDYYNGSLDTDVNLAENVENDHSMLLDDSPSTNPTD